jgi:hypothetical protein
LALQLDAPFIKRCAISGVCGQNRFDTCAFETCQHVLASLLADEKFWRVELQV